MLQCHSSHSKLLKSYHSNSGQFTQQTNATIISWRCVPVSQDVVVKISSAIFLVVHIDHSFTFPNFDCCQTLIAASLIAVSNLEGRQTWHTPPLIMMPCFIGIVLARETLICLWLIMHLALIFARNPFFLFGNIYYALKKYKIFYKIHSTVNALWLGNKMVRW